MRSVPAIKAALILALGIVLGDQLRAADVAWLMIAAVLLLLLGLIGLRRPWGNAPIGLSIVLLGILLSTASRLPQSDGGGMFQKPIFIEGRIISQPYRAENRVVSVLRPSWISTDGHSKKDCRADVRVVGGTGSDLRDGSTIIAAGEIRSYPERRNPGGRDWREEFARQNIMGWIRPDALTVLQEGKPDLAHRARAALGKILHLSLPPRQADLLTGMILGDKSVIPEDLNDDFKRSGLYHLLVVSGSNIGYLLATLTLLIGPFGLSLRLRRRLLHAGIWGYVVLTGFNSATVRAAIMISLLLLSFEFQRAPRRWNLLGAAALLILLFAPQQLFQPGFQLSFAAMAGVLLATDISVRKDLALPPLSVKARRMSRWIKRYLTLPLLMSLFAVLFTAPILIYHFGGFAPSAILTNLLAIPLAGAIFGLTWLVILLKVALGLSISLLNGGLEAGLKGLESLAATGSVLPGNASSAYGGFWAACLLAGMTAGWFLIISRRRKVIWLGAAAVLWLFLAFRETPRDLEIEFLDVSQGDATLLRFPAGKNLLVDCGDANAARFELIPSLLRRGLRHLDDLLLTHFDGDHAGGAQQVMQSLRVNRLLVNCLEPEDSLGRSILETARQLNIPIRQLALGDTLAEFRGARCLVLWPPKALRGEDNSESIVMRVSYGACDVLLTGDISRTEETVLLACDGYLQSEILKIPHHGSAKSSSPAFLRQVRPKYVLIGCGADNPYGHPNPRVLEELQAMKCDVHRTDRDCAGIWRSDGQEVWPVDWR